MSIMTLSDGSDDIKEPFAREKVFMTVPDDHERKVSSVFSENRPKPQRTHKGHEGSHDEVIPVVDEIVNRSWSGVGSAKRHLFANRTNGLASPSSSSYPNFNDSPSKLPDGLEENPLHPLSDTPENLIKYKKEVVRLSDVQLHESPLSPQSLSTHSSSLGNAGSNSTSLKNHNQQNQNSRSAAGSVRSSASFEIRRRPNQKVGNDIPNFVPSKDVEMASATPLPPSPEKSSSKSHSKSLTASGEGRSASKAVPHGRSQAVSPTPYSSGQSSSIPPSHQLKEIKSTPKSSAAWEQISSPTSISLPAPPLSLPTYLQLELSSVRPSPLYIRRPEKIDFPYESLHVKLNRLQNFIYLPPHLEQVLWFGTLACLDAWLHAFTILPLRFLKAFSIFGQSLIYRASQGIQFMVKSVYFSTRKAWARRQTQGKVDTDFNPLDRARSRQRHSSNNRSLPKDSRRRPSGQKENRRIGDSHSHSRRKSGNGDLEEQYTSKSLPPDLLPSHKADILKGLLIIFSCFILMYFDASRMYHGIRGQAAIKLYVIYNVLEVCDRLFSAFGQDVLECLLSTETLDYKPNGHMNMWRVIWLFFLALIYNIIHATALFYQVITLNVAVNSYSNALLTLLLSNQFVEIKSTVFKRIEKENLFQLTCADIVERFQLWLMLTIIASRNIIETGGLGLGLGGFSGGNLGTEPAFATSGKGSSILPHSFTMLPKWTGQVMGPFMIVLGSEMLVDWIKHAYITKFNKIKPNIYGRFFDVLAKDYYCNAFGDQNLIRRLGLPVIPLASLFIRASVQTYRMFLTTHMPLPIPSTATSLSVESATSSPATTAALQHIDHIFRRALGRSSFGAGGAGMIASDDNRWTPDDVIALLTMVVFFLIVFFVLLALKLVLGMFLLSLAQRRYQGMKENEIISTDAEGRRFGGWGVVEVDDEKRNWIYNDDTAGAKRMKEREMSTGNAKGKDDLFAGVVRYNMVAKRIW